MGRIKYSLDFSVSNVTKGKNTVAHHEETSPGMKHDIGLTPVTLGLAVLAGSGMTLMIIAGGIGVITGTGVNLLFALGLVALVGGGVAWVAVERPFTHFDDIDKPLDGGHAPAHDEAHGEDVKLIAAHSEADSHASHGAHH